MLSYKFIVPLAVVALTATACSDDNKHHETPTDPNAISFDVAVPKASRAVTTTQSISEFRVWSFAAGKPFMQNVLVSRTDGSGWTYNPTMYWPLNEPLNFYCVSPFISTSLELKGNEADIPGFVNTDGKTDLLYAVNMRETKSPVHVNFRHALSQVNFYLKRAQRSASPIRVEVNAVDLLDTYHTGDFEYPEQTTAPNDFRAIGDWDNQRNVQDASIFKGAMIAIEDNDSHHANNTGYIFAIPQDLRTSVVTGNSHAGSYARVLCAVYDQNTNLKLWPPTSLEHQATGAGYVYFPLNDNARIDEWEPGRAYNYTLTIDVPASASSISFDVTVDEMNDFVNADL